MKCEKCGRETNFMIRVIVANFPGSFGGKKKGWCVFCIEEQASEEIAEQRKKEEEECNVVNAAEEIVT